MTSLCCNSHRTFPLPCRGVKRKGEKKAQRRRRRRCRTRSSLGSAVSRASTSTSTKNIRFVASTRLPSTPRPRSPPPLPRRPPRTRPAVKEMSAATIPPKSVGDKAAKADSKWARLPRERDPVSCKVRLCGTTTQRERVPPACKVSNRTKGCGGLGLEGPFCCVADALERKEREKWRRSSTRNGFWGGGKRRNSRSG